MVQPKMSLSQVLLYELTSEAHCSADDMASDCLSQLWLNARKHTGGTNLHPTLGVPA